MECRQLTTNTFFFHTEQRMKWILTIITSVLIPSFWRGGHILLEAARWVPGRGHQPCPVTSAQPEASAAPWLPRCWQPSHLPVLFQLSPLPNFPPPSNHEQNPSVSTCWIKQSAFFLIFHTQSRFCLHRDTGWRQSQETDLHSQVIKIILAHKPMFSSAPADLQKLVHSSLNGKGWERHHPHYGNQVEGLPQAWGAQGSSHPTPMLYSGLVAVA